MTHQRKDGVTLGEILICLLLALLFTGMFVVAIDKTIEIEQTQEVRR